MDFRNEVGNLVTYRVQRQVLGRINGEAESGSKVNGFTGAREKKAMIGRRTSLFPGGHRLRYPGVMGAPYREVNSKVATAPKLKVEDKDRVNNSKESKR